MMVRPRSLYAVELPDPKPHVFDERVDFVMGPRAFDRLDDEIWSLFFAGDPRVSLRNAEAPQGGRT